MGGLTPNFIFRKVRCATFLTHGVVLLVKNNVHGSPTVCLVDLVVDSVSHSFFFYNSFLPSIHYSWWRGLVVTRWSRST